MIFKDIDLKELFRLMKEHDIDETTLQDGKTTVSVKRNREPVVLNNDDLLINAYNQNQFNNRQLTTEDVILSEDSQQGTEHFERNSDVPCDLDNSNLYKIQAPLVGTFYRASSPDSSPYVEVGDQVNPGDVLCIVEAMKSMNEIQSDIKGVVKEICAQNAQLVEFDQVMFQIELN